MLAENRPHLLGGRTNEGEDLATAPGHPHPGAADRGGVVRVRPAVGRVGRRADALRQRRHPPGRSSPSTAASASPRCWSRRATGSKRGSCWRASTPQRLEHAVATPRPRSPPSGRWSPAWRRARVPRRSARRAPTSRRPQAEAQQRRAHRPAPAEPASPRSVASQQDADDARAAADAAQARLKAAQRSAGPGRRRPAQGGHRRGQGHAARPTRPQLALAQRSSPTPAVRARRRRHPEPHPRAGRHGLAADGRSSRWPSTDPLWVRAYVAEPDLGQIRPGMAAAVTTDSYPGQALRGWVGFISPTAEFTPKTVETSEVRTQLVYQVRVFVCNPHGRAAPRHAGDRHASPLDQPQRSATGQRAHPIARGP